MDFNIKKFCDFLNNFELFYDKTPSYIYHYTSSEAAKNILQYGTLRFTDRYYMNDYSEGKYVIELSLEKLDEILEAGKFRDGIRSELLKRANEIQQDNFYVYQCSFSDSDDSLCLWNYYTKNTGIKGYNFKFSASGIEDAIRPESVKPEKKPPVYSGKVIYDETEQVKIIAEILINFLNYSKENDSEDRHVNFIASYAVDKLYYQGIFFKKKYFEVESEYRVAIVPYVDDNGEFLAIKAKRDFMERNGIFIPYVDLQFEKDSLEGITMSPTLDPEVTRQSLLSLVENKYSKIDTDTIFQSHIPVRY